MGSPGPVSVAPSLFPALPYDPVNGLMAVASVVRIPSILVTRPAFRAQDMKGLIALAKKEPDRIRICQRWVLWDA